MSNQIDSQAVVLDPILTGRISHSNHRIQFMDNLVACRDSGNEKNPSN